MEKIEEGFTLKDFLKSFNNKENFIIYTKLIYSIKFKKVLKEKQFLTLTKEITKEYEDYK